MTTVALSADQARAKMLKQFAETLKEQIGDYADCPTEEQFVIYTGEVRIWINVDAARAGRISLNLRNASRYADRANAEADARQVTNGHGQRGQVCTYREACIYDVGSTAECIQNLMKHA